MATLTRLMACGQICLHHLDVQIVRGMDLLDTQGHKLGKVTAVLETKGQLSHILLGSQQETQETFQNRLIPAQLINSVTENAITLALPQAELKTFPIHCPDF